MKLQTVYTFYKSGKLNPGPFSYITRFWSEEYSNWFLLTLNFSLLRVIITSFTENCRQLNLFIMLCKSRLNLGICTTRVTFYGSKKLIWNSLWPNSNVLVLSETQLSSRRLKFFKGLRSCSSYVNSLKVICKTYKLCAITTKGWNKNLFFLMVKLVTFLTN